MKENYELVSMNLAVFNRQEPILTITILQDGKIISVNTNRKEQINEILTDFVNGNKISNIDLNSEI